MGVITALISGALMSIQGVWNTQLTKETSQWVTNSYVQATALGSKSCCMVFYRKGKLCKVVFNK